MFKEPFISINRIAISIDNINKGIELHQRHQSVIPDLADVPEDRCCPHPNLQADINDLGKIPEKDGNRTGTVAHCQHQYKQTEAVIHDLDRIDGRIVSVDSGYNKQYSRKKYMDKGSCYQLNDRQDTDVKYHLFHQIAVLQKGIGAAGDPL